MARQYNGSSDHADSTLSLSGLSALTVACWVRSTGAGNVVVGSSNYDGSNLTAILCLGGAPGGAYNGFAYFQGGVGWKASGVATDVRNSGAWHHVVGVFTGSTSVQLYVDGVLDSQNTTGVAATLPAGSNPWVWGRYQNDSIWFSGDIAEGGVWDAALIAAETASLAAGEIPLNVRPGSLIAYWPQWGDDSPEPDLHDVGATRYALTVTGATKANHAPVGLDTRPWRSEPTVAATVPPPGRATIVRQTVNRAATF